MSELYECTACGKDVSKNAMVCPHCGDSFSDTSVIDLISSRLAIVILLALILIMQIATFAKPISSYEYRIVGIKDERFDEEMKNYGNKGWELVFARRATSDNDPLYEVIFKRVK